MNTTTTTKQRIYFMDVIGDHEDDVLEVLVGCRACGHRQMTQTLGEARLWVHDHHADQHTTSTPAGVDMIGDVPRGEVEPRRDRAQDWETVSTVLENGDGFITIAELEKLLKVTHVAADSRVREWTKAGLIVSSGRKNMSSTFCRTEDTHLHEEARVKDILSSGPLSVRFIGRKLGYVDVSRRLQSMLNALIVEGTVEKIGSGPTTAYQLITT
jgi:hypothetical protein